MTSLVSWAGVDNRLIASIYFASDSRFSSEKGESFEHGTKTFASSVAPDIFAFFGAVNFACQFLDEFVAQLDRGMHFDERMRGPQRFTELQTILQTSLNVSLYRDYPFAISYAHRRGTKMDSEFFVGMISCEKGMLYAETFEMPNSSDLVFVRGSGAEYVAAELRKWRKTAAGDTSRALFSAFCDSVDSGADPLTGGAPQLVGLFREGNGKSFCLFHNQTFYRGGKVIDPKKQKPKIVFNKLFEHCNANGEVTGQRQPRPKDA